MIVVTAELGQSFKGSITDFKQYTAEVLVVVLRNKKTTFRPQDVVFSARKSTSLVPPVDIRLRVAFAQSTMREEDRADREMLIRESLEELYSGVAIRVQLNKHLEVFAAGKTYAWDPETVHINDVVTRLREDIILKEVQNGNHDNFDQLSSDSKERIISRFIQGGNVEEITALLFRSDIVPRRIEGSTDKLTTSQLIDGGLPLNGRVVPQDLSARIPFSDPNS